MSIEFMKFVSSRIGYSKLNPILVAINQTKMKMTEKKSYYHYFLLIDNTTITMNTIISSICTLFNEVPL